MGGVFPVRGAFCARTLRMASLLSFLVKGHGKSTAAGTLDAGWVRWLQELHKCKWVKHVYMCDKPTAVPQDLRLVATVVQLYSP